MKLPSPSTGWTRGDPSVSTALRGRDLVQPRRRGGTRRPPHGNRRSGAPIGIGLVVVRRQRHVSLRARPRQRGDAPHMPAAGHRPIRV